MTAKFALSWWESLKACLRREYTVMERNSFLFIFRMGQVSLQKASLSHLHRAQSHVDAALCGDTIGWCRWLESLL